MKELSPTKFKNVPISAYESRILADKGGNEIAWNERQHWVFENFDENPVTVTFTHFKETKELDETHKSLVVPEGDSLIVLNLGSNFKDENGIVKVEYSDFEQLTVMVIEE